LLEMVDSVKMWLCLEKETAIFELRPTYPVLVRPHKRTYQGYASCFAYKL
jgi:hypothetical protein